MEKYYYSYNEFLKDTKELTLKAKEFKPDTLLAIARGGLTLAHFIANGLNIRRLYTLNSIHYIDDKKLDTLEIFNIPNLDDAKRVLIIDDIIDSGETLEAILDKLKRLYPNIEFKIATIFYKPSAKIKAHYTVKKATLWVDFFWEVDSL